MDFRGEAAVCGAPGRPNCITDRKVNFAELQANYSSATPKIIVVDDLLSPKALNSLHSFATTSTFWNGIKETYFGSVMVRGFASFSLLAISLELAAAFPAIFCSHVMTQMWAFSYSNVPAQDVDAKVGGVGMHADGAAVNVNFWLTPTEHNLVSTPDDPSGGLRVYHCGAPLELSHAAYNQGHEQLQRHVDEHPEECGFTDVPYRRNRAVIFDSNLIHETIPANFKPGFDKRRINLTFLYGNRGASCKGSNGLDASKQDL